MNPDKKQRAFVLWWPSCGAVCKNINSSLFDYEPINTKSERRFTVILTVADPDRVKGFLEPGQNFQI